ncbi:hypothetical protein IWZ03DRAFT_113281 [Phyllosticta citriasiana]|uniref:Uncharacterized protein n=1 Tax=Phyllosticta citriasiana TaxID=595635 RepID=A0ABR1KVN6_9PEZI
MPLCPLWTGSLIIAVDNDATAAIHASGSVNAAKRCVCGFCAPHGGTGVLDRGGQGKQPTIDDYDDDDDAGLCTLAPVGTRGISSARRRDRRGVCAGTNLAQCRVHSSGPARRVVVVVVDEQASKQASRHAGLALVRLSGQRAKRLMAAEPTLSLPFPCALGSPGPVRCSFFFFFFPSSAV